MALIEFKNKPNTDTPINDDNLNHNFKELDERTNYSTEEKVVGTWINGKPLYRKSITFTSTISSNSLMTKAHNISNVDFIRIKEFILSETTGTTYSLPLVGYSGNLTDKTYAYVNKNNIYAYSNGGWGAAWTKIVVLEYTKTTD